ADGEQLSRGCDAIVGRRRLLRACTVRGGRKLGAAEKSARLREDGSPTRIGQLLAYDVDEIAVLAGCPVVPLARQTAMRRAKAHGETAAGFAMLVADDPMISHFPAIGQPRPAERFCVLAEGAGKIGCVLHHAASARSTSLWRSRRRESTASSLTGTKRRVVQEMISVKQPSALSAASSEGEKPTTSSRYSPMTRERRRQCPSAMSMVAPRSMTASSTSFGVISTVALIPSCR